MSRHILCIEDEREIASLLSFHLSKAGYEVDAAYSGREAIETIRCRRPDLILLDLMLPDIDGFALCEILRGNPGTATIPIIVVSAWASGDSHGLGLELGALDYITKPFSPREVVERVGRFMECRPALR